MLDDYGLRLLAEMGIEVYLPRADTAARGADAALPAENPSHAAPSAATPRAVRSAHGDIFLLGHESAAKTMLADLLRATRLLGLEVAPGDAKSADSLAHARGLIVLGETLARDLGASLPAQRQNAIDWVVVATPADLARSAAARRALWGEIKRLARVSGPAQSR
jgi:hypothetical protein